MGATSEGSESVVRGNDSAMLPIDMNLSLNIMKDLLIEAQQCYVTLKPCYTFTAKQGESDMPVMFFIESGVLQRSWSPAPTGLHKVHQVVVPKEYRSRVLSLAHNASSARHLGINKTYQRVLRHFFFWPGLKADVAKHCRSCHTCQMVGKPNKPILPAPLQPILVIGEPFERVLLDCVGPLPKTKSGHQYILTVMCAATRFPEAFPLRTVKTKGIVKALTKFFSTFGLPRVIRTDQGTNFMSKIFTQLLKELRVEIRHLVRIILSRKGLWRGFTRH